jgi:hypothetical protein
MNTINPRLQRLITDRGSRRSGRHLRPQLVADGVVASYIHDISARHRRRDHRTQVPIASRRRLARVTSG